MTLPTTLMPSGAFSAMRGVAQLFMTTPMTIYDVTETYSMYGEPIRFSGAVWSGLGYIGKLSARDIDLVTSTDFYRSRDDGSEVTYMSTILLPENTLVEDNYRIVVNNTEWQIIWNNIQTSSAVRFYTKIVARDTRYLKVRTLGED